jgi:hypothetical protein
MASSSECCFVVCEGGVVSEGMFTVSGLLREILSTFDPDAYSGSECAEIAEDLAMTVKACTAGISLAAARAVREGSHRERGFTDGERWLAHQSGSTRHDARRALETAGRLGDCPDTRQAFLAGLVSLAQAGEITGAEADTPGGEQELLEVACGGDLSEVRDHARRRRLELTDVDVLHRHQHTARRFRHWKDRAGMVCFTGALPPEAGVPFVHRLELATLRARKTAGEQREEWEAHAADAFVQITSGTGPGRPVRPELVIVCDINAWRRGHGHPGEPCHILDGGPIPVQVAKQLSEDPFLKAVITDGVNVHTVKHFGRHLPAELRTALDLGPGPGFAGAECVDCGRRWGLQWDHINPVANRGPTSFDNLAGRCWTDHQAKTERDRQAGLLGPNPPNPHTKRRGPSARPEQRGSGP